MQEDGDLALLEGTVDLLHATDTKKQTYPRRIAVVAPMGTLDHQPGVLHAIACFAEAGYEVEVLALRNVHYPLMDFESDQVSVRYLPVSFRSRRESRLWATFLFTIWLPFVLRGKYTAVYGAGVRALLAVWFASWFKKMRIINYQLELYIGAKLDMRFSRVFKWLERRAVRACLVSLEHDENRAKMLCEDLGIPRERVEIIPNAPRGEGKVRHSSFLADKFGLGKDVRILLNAGTLDAKFMAEETVVAAQNLAPGWTCVMHSANSLPHNDPYVARLQAANKRRRAVFSLEPVPYGNVPDLLSSADIGLALYGWEAAIGLASGKLCHFLQLGVPVIVSDFPTIREFVTRHRVGVPIADLADLPQAVETIMDDYEGYCNRAAETFTRELAFQTHFQRVLDRLDSV